jgi:hypothetical protein
MPATGVEASGSRGRGDIGWAHVTYTEGVDCDDISWAGRAAGVRPRGQASDWQRWRGVSQPCGNAERGSDTCIGARLLLCTYVSLVDGK